MLFRWMSFSLFDIGLNNSRSGTVALSGDHYQTLRSQYIKTAQQLIAEQEFQKAAFIYMKLLKDYYGAANTLAEGQYFQEAAAIHLKHTQDKSKAAECYEKGRMIPQAIELYKELNQDEKVGDLYLSIHKKKEAHAYFGKVIENYRSTSQYVKASLIYKNKIEDPQQAQSLLMEGWRSNKDAFNCLNNYFSNIPDLQLLEHEITQIYITDTPGDKKEVYLRVLKYEFDKHAELEETTREIAYQIIAERVAQNPSIVSELPSFNKKDKHLLKDVLKYKLGRNKNRAEK